MSVDSQPRFLITIGVGNYAHAPELHLGYVPDEVRRVRRLFTEQLGYTVALPELGENPDAEMVRQALARWFRDADPAAIVVVYVTCHGYTDPKDRKHFLLMSKFEEGLLAATALTTASLGEVLRESNLHHVLFVIDACWAEGGVHDLASVAGQLAGSSAPSPFPLGVFTIATALAKEPAAQLAFVTALEATIDDPAVAGASLPYIPVDALMHRLRLRMPDDQHPQCDATIGGIARFFPNPRYRPELRPGMDLESQRRRDLAAHWTPRARGIDVGPEWYFSGRDTVLRELVRWMEHPIGDGKARMITGRPGVGKSAVLARLVTLSDVETRAALPLVGIAADTVPRKGIINVAVHAKQKTLDDLAAEMGTALGATDASSVGELINHLAVLPIPKVMIVDALDEAIDPPAIARELLRPLSQLPRLRLLIGTRPELAGSLGPNVVRLDLDDPALGSLDDMVTYVQRRLLCESDPDRRTPYRGETEQALDVARAVAERAFPVFLVAKLVSDSLITRQDMANPRERITFPENVGDAFDAYLDRLLGDRSRAWELLIPLAYAEGAGLPWGSIWARFASLVAGTTYRDADVEWVRERLGAYIVEDVEEGVSVYRLYHQALAEHIRDKTTGRAAAIHASAVDVLCRGVPEAAPGMLDWRQSSSYARLHLAAHAQAAGQLATFLKDPLYLVTAAPNRLLRVVQQALDVGAEGRAYEAGVHLVRGKQLPDALMDLQLFARQSGADELADRITRLPISFAYETRWARWRRGAHHRTLSGHEHWVTSVAIGMVDRRAVIVSGSYDRTVRVWDAQTGEAVGKPLSAHEDTVRSVAIGTVDGRDVIVSGCDDGTVHVRDAQTGEDVCAPLAMHMGGVQSVAIGKVGGRPVIVSGGLDQTVRVRDMRTGEAVGAMLLRNEIRSVAVETVGGRDVIVSGGDDQMVHVWDAHTGETVKTIGGHQGWVTSVAVGTLNGLAVIVSGSNDGTVRVWDAQTGDAVGRPLSGHGDEVRCVAVGTESGRSVIVSGSSDGTVRVWDAKTGDALEPQLTGHERSVDGVAIGSIGGRTVIVSGSDDRTVRIWDSPTAETIGAPGGQECMVRSVAVGIVDGRAVIVSGGDDRMVRVWDAHTGQSWGAPLSGHEHFVMSVGIGTVDGRDVVVSGSVDRTVRIWDARTGEAVGAPLGHDGAVTSVAVGAVHGRTVIVSGSFDRTVRVWDAQTRAAVRAPLAGHEILFGIGGVEVGAMGGQSVVASVATLNRTVRVRDALTGQEVGAPLLHKDGVTSVAVGSVGGRIVIISGSLDHRVHVWDAQTREEVCAPLSGHRGTIRSVAVGKLGGRDAIVSGGDDRTVRVWDARSGEATILDVNGAVASVRVGADEFLAVGGGLGVVAIQCRVPCRG